MVTKKRRRTQLHRASLQRQQLRRAERERKRKRIRRITTAVVLVVAVTVLAIWIGLHRTDSTAGSQQGARPVDYPAGAAQVPHLAQTTAQTTAPTTGGPR